MKPNSRSGELGQMYPGQGPLRAPFDTLPGLFSKEGTRLDSQHEKQAQAERHQALDTGEATAKVSRGFQPTMVSGVATSLSPVRSRSRSTLLATEPTMRETPIETPYGEAKAHVLPIEAPARFHGPYRGYGDDETPD